MAAIGGVTASVGVGLIAQAEQNVGTSASLLKKAVQADKDLVATLLPPPPANGGVDVRA